MSQLKRVTWVEVSARRLSRQGLVTPMPDAGAADVVAAMCATHAQVLSAAELSIGLRLADATRVDVRDALWVDRTVVKTFGPRGTVHLLPTRDLPMWTGALSAMPPARSPFRDDVRMTAAQTESVLAAIADAVSAAELTIDELTEAVVQRAGAWAGDLVMPAFQVRWPRWRQALALAGHRGVLCFGPNRGRNVTYTSPLRWLPDLRPTDGTTALAALLRGYLSAYGPASPQHFARWLNAAPAWAAQLFDSLGGEIEQVELDGTPAWQLAGDDTTSAEPAAAGGVRLLPYFDSYTVAAQPRELAFPGRAAERALTGGQAGNVPVLLVDGTVAGVWHQKRSARRIAVTVEPLSVLTAGRRRQLEAQVARVGEILEATASLTLGTVTTGPHA
jgi:hypothetical protein